MHPLCKIPVADPSCQGNDVLIEVLQCVAGLLPLLYKLLLTFTMFLWSCLPDSTSIPRRNNPSSANVKDDVSSLVTKEGVKIKIVEGEIAKQTVRYYRLCKMF